MALVLKELVGTSSNLLTKFLSDLGSLGLTSVPSAARIITRDGTSKPPRGATSKQLLRPACSAVSALVPYFCLSRNVVEW